MKKLLYLILFVAFQSVHAQAHDPDFNDKVAFGEGRNHQKSVSFSESDDYSTYDLLHQQLNFTIDPAVRYISGSVFSSVKFLKDNVSKIQFDLAVSMNVDSVKFNQELTIFEHSTNKIDITFPVVMQKNSIGKFEVFYHGSPPQTGFGSFMVSKHDNTPILWTLSEPYGAMDWWPCKQSLADKIDSMDVYISCPQQYKAASIGKLISDQVNMDTRTAHWRHRYPIATYLVGIAVTNYESYSDFLDLADGKKIEVLNYVYPEYLNTAKSKSTEILSILDFYNTKFITYPFASEKYGHAQFGWGGGMEHQTMSFMSNLNFQLVAHEMAHQWFGDYITLASWHDIWLNEGFATYLSGLTYENLLNGEYWQNWKKDLIAAITSSPGGSVYVVDTTNVSRIFNGRLSYSKGAYLLHMLRWEMGDYKFFKGMLNYLKDPEIANGFASQEKFVKHMETVADISFTEFFKDWYYGEGYPTYQFTYFPDPENDANQKLRINQTPSHPSVVFFEMHVPIRVWSDGKSADFRLYNTLQNQEFDLLSGKIDSVQFDPDKWLIAKTDNASKTQELADNDQIKIIPEFINNRIRIVLPGFKGSGTFRIIDLSGRTIKEYGLQGKDSSVDLSSLKNGIYLAEVQTKDQKQTEKIRISK